MKLRTLIADDEAPARDRLRGLAAQIPDMSIVAEAQDGIECLELAETTEFDLALLDIEMPELDGLSVAYQLMAQTSCAIIFATAYDQYAIKAFEVNAVDYLLKPFDLARFSQAIERAIQRRSISLQDRLGSIRQVGHMWGDSAHGQRLLVKDGEVLHVIHTDDLIWVEADGNNVKLCAKQGIYFQRMPLAMMENRLAGSGFARCHRSHLVKLKEVERLTPLFKGDYLLYLKDGTELRLSRHYAKSFLELLENASH